MNEKEYIYKLVDPNTKECRYIGKSNNPKSRLKQHIFQAKSDCRQSGTSTPKSTWIKSLIDSGEIPIVSIVETCNSDNVLSREKYWIKKEAEAGSNLTNLDIVGRGKYKSANSHRRITLTLDYDMATWLRAYTKNSYRTISSQTQRIIEFYMKENNIDIHDLDSADM